MHTSDAYAHVAERLFGEWADFLSGHHSPPEDTVPPTGIRLDDAPEPAMLENAA
jgi:hypothetical protein